MSSPKEIRCRRFANENQEVNERYRINVPKEELLLEHVRLFEKQFLQVYGERFLFVCPPNEYSLPKFLPTTLRPTHLVTGSSTITRAARSSSRTSSTTSSCSRRIGIRS
jgi:hypothetical protein